MRWPALIGILIAIAGGCSVEPAKTPDSTPSVTTSKGEQVPPEVVKALEGVSREQSQGLKDAQVVVHRAYEYKGYTWLEPIESARLIAVDVEFRNYSRGLDLDDVDIVDGSSNENYGSGPQIASLTLDGKLATDVNDTSWPVGLGPLRVLLIYAFPKKSNTIKLSYWGKELTPQPIRVGGDGPLLPVPKPKE